MQYKEYIIKNKFAKAAMEDNIANTDGINGQTPKPFNWVRSNWVNGQKIRGNRGNVTSGPTANNEWQVHRRRGRSSCRKGSKVRKRGLNITNGKAGTIGVI